MEDMGDLEDKHLNIIKILTTEIEDIFAIMGDIGDAVSSMSSMCPLSREKESTMIIGECPLCPLCPLCFSKSSKISWLPGNESQLRQVGGFGVYRMKF
jgi:hypothetical protein